MPIDLTPEKALIFRITHRDNVPWLLEHGLCCKNWNVRDPNFVEIGNPELIARRTHHRVDCPTGGTLSDYIPFYFTPKSVMLFNIKTGYNGIRRRSNDEIVILAASIRKLQERRIRYTFTDRHAYLAAANFYTDPADLDKIDWQILRNHDFEKDPDDPGKFERYQAEALVFQHLPVEELNGIACHSAAQQKLLQNQLAARGLEIKTAVKDGWYF